MLLNSKEYELDIKTTNAAFKSCVVLTEKAIVLIRVIIKQLVEDNNLKSEEQRTQATHCCSS